MSDQPETCDLLFQQISDISIHVLFLYQIPCGKISIFDLTVPKLKWIHRKVRHWFGHDTISLIRKK